MAILLTGGAGYIGSMTAKILKEKGYEVIVLDNLSRGHSFIVQEVLKLPLYIGEVGDIVLLEKIFAENKIEAVFHFAAFAYVGESVSDPISYYQNNFKSGLNLIEFCIKKKIDKFIFSSTCASYGIPNHTPIVETLHQKPINPYGSSKLMIEKVIEDVRKAHDLNYICFRYFNAAGADPEGELGELHDPEPHLIPIVLEVANGKRNQVKIFGDDYPTPDGTCVRDYLHVYDIAMAHVLGYEYLQQNDAGLFLNLGNESGYSVKEVIETAEKVTDNKINYSVDMRRAGDPPVLIADAKLAKQILGWKPKYTSLEEMIKHAWDWSLRQK